MHTERPTVARHQDFKVASCLRRLHDAKGILASRYWHVGGIVTSDLHKHPTVRTTLICLPRRVQEAWPIPQTRRHFLGITHSLTYSLQGLLVGIVHLDI